MLSGGSSRLSCPISDSQMILFAVVVRLLLPLCRCVFHNFSFWVPSASYDDVLLLGLAATKTSSRHGALCGGLDLDNEASSLICIGSYGQANYDKQSSTSSSLVLPVD